MESMLCRNALWKILGKFVLHFSSKFMSSFIFSKFELQASTASSLPKLLPEPSSLGQDWKAGLWNAWRLAARGARVRWSDSQRPLPMQSHQTRRRAANLFHEKTKRRKNRYRARFGRSRPWSVDWKRALRVIFWNQGRLFFTKLFSVPTWLPKTIEPLCRAASTSKASPSKVSAQRALREFKHTHHDQWEEHQHKVILDRLFTFHEFANAFFSVQRWAETHVNRYSCFTELLCITVFKFSIFLDYFSLF